jgi:queuine tRNA-ribosyltransferase
MSPKLFHAAADNLPLPIFFPDATRAVLKSLDSQDIAATKTPGILVNTYHLYRELAGGLLEKTGGIRSFMNWHGGVISDSGGFQVMSIAKRHGGKTTNSGVIFKLNGKTTRLTPEESIRFQMNLVSDMLVVLDDFTPPGASRRQAKETVDRTVLWAKKSKAEFEKICDDRGLKSSRPYILGVVQGGDFLDLRKECLERLVEIGFDGLGYGGWPITQNGEFNYKVAECIKKYSPDNYFLYGLGIGKPEEIVNCVKLGYHIFDCVLPSRDARHRRLYVYSADSIDKIDIRKPNFYSYYTPDKSRFRSDTNPVSSACDCHLCKNYSRAYLAHLFRIKEVSALRLATIHNLRFYSILMQKLAIKS